MNRSKWNTVASIPMWTLTKEELKEAIKDWAEGCEALEQLLWACHDNGVVTLGSCAHSGYIDMDLTTSDKENLKKLFAGAMLFGHGMIMVSRCGNPYSGPDWWKPTISFGVRDKREEIEKLFVALSGSMTATVSGKCEEVYEPLMRIHETFAQTGNDITLRLEMKDHTPYEYKLSVEFSSREEYFCNLLENAGMQAKFDERGCSGCVIEEHEYSEFVKKIQSVSEIVRAEHSLAYPTEITEEMSFSEKVLFLRKKFGIDCEGVEKMNKWLNKNKPNAIMRDVHY